MALCRAIYLLFVLLFTGLPFVQPQDTDHYLHYISQNSVLRQFYFPHHNQTIHLIDLVLNDEQRSTGAACDSSLSHLRNGLINFEDWAVKFYEASGKPKNGKLFGYNGDLGDFDQCLSIQTELPGQARQFRGQYCLVSLQTEEIEWIKRQPIYHKNSVGLSESSRFITDFSLGTVQGVCLPSTCDINDVLDSVNKASTAIKVVPQKHCSVADQFRRFSIVEIVAFGSFGFLALLSIVSTLLPYRCLQPFHVGHNFMKLYQTNESADAMTTSHLHGTKVGYLFFGIMGHTWGMLLPFAPFLYGGFKSLQFHWILRGILDRILLGPDMMFFISGFLSMWTWYGPMRKFRIGFRKYFVIRFLRCMTVVGIAILGGYIWPRFGSGPYFAELSEHFHQSCSKNVWKNLLMINNQDRMMDICALPTWFLSSDFQLYVQHYLTIHFFAVQPRIGFLIAAIQILLNGAYTIVDTYLNDYPRYMACTHMTALHSIEVEQQYFFTYLHSNVYTLGIICGWLVASKKEIKLSSLSVCLLWIGTLTLTFSTVYLPDLWHFNYISVPPIFLLVWPAISKIIFTSAIFWSVYSSAFGYNRVLKRILSCGFMISMSRMSMSIVTCQFFYLWYYLGSRRDLIRLNSFELLREGLLAFFVCWFIGSLVHLFVEAPMVNLLYLAFGLRRRVELSEQTKSEIDPKKPQFTELAKSAVDEKSKVNEDCKSAITSSDANAATSATMERVQTMETLVNEGSESTDRQRIQYDVDRTGSRRWSSRST